MNVEMPTPNTAAASAAAAAAGGAPTPPAGPSPSSDAANRKRKAPATPSATPPATQGIARSSKMFRPSQYPQPAAAAAPAGGVFTSDSFIDHQRALMSADIAPTPHGPIANMPPTPAFGDHGTGAFDNTPTDDSFSAAAAASGATSAQAAAASKHATPTTMPRATPLNLRSFAGWNVSSRYQLVRLLGKGSYGQVAEAYDSVRQKKVAIKRIVNVFEQEIDCKRLYREIYILRRLNHPQVIKLLDVIPPENYESFSDLYLVFEFVDTDLHKLIMSPQYLTIRHIQVFLYQLLCGLKYIHSANVIHRDMKPANILLNEDCTLMICDFGLSRVVESDRMAESGKDLYSPKDAKSPTTSDMSTPSPSTTPSGGNSDVPKFKRQLTKHVVTRWYRAPELILLQDYNYAVDMWSIGCIFAELLSMQVESCPRYQERVPLFPGRSCFPLSADRPTTYSDKLDQLNVIFNVIGTPTENDIGNLGEVKQYLRKLPKKEPRDLREMFPGAPVESLDLLKRMLAFNPDCRLSVDEALNHPFLAPVRRPQAETLETNPFGMEFENVPLDKEALKARHGTNPWHVDDMATTSRHDDVVARWVSRPASESAALPSLDAEFAVLQEARARNAELQARLRETQPLLWLDNAVVLTRPRSERKRPTARASARRREQTRSDGDDSDASDGAWDPVEHVAAPSRRRVQWEVAKRIARVERELRQRPPAQRYWNVRERNRALEAADEELRKDSEVPRSTRRDNPRREHSSTRKEATPHKRSDKPIPKTVSRKAIEPARTTTVAARPEPPREQQSTEDLKLASLDDSWLESLPGDQSRPSDKSQLQSPEAIDTANKENLLFPGERCTADIVASEREPTPLPPSRAISPPPPSESDAKERTDSRRCDNNTLHELTTADEQVAPAAPCRVASPVPQLAPPTSSLGRQVLSEFRSMPSAASFGAAPVIVTAGPTGVTKKLNGDMLRRLFSDLDSDGDGLLNRIEVSVALHRLQLSVPAPTIVSFFRRLNSTHSVAPLQEAINFKQFVAFVTTAFDQRQQQEERQRRQRKVEPRVTEQEKSRVANPKSISTSILEPRSEQPIGFAPHFVFADFVVLPVINDLINLGSCRWANSGKYSCLST
ncbi:hypothetical protein P43SY_003905 [Pythium insidiosum]|uniref:Mitogen-activated protein kinase n=1 Tax=Pythium insidiosum TaxID=114742 RepID=A0AAD5Q895_PYTIN|nr:hypothetical protein P43SY_003905 [Pythium insidiosum]